MITGGGTLPGPGVAAGLEGGGADLALAGAAFGSQRCVRGLKTYCVDGLALLTFGSSPVSTGREKAPAPLEEALTRGACS